MAHCGDYQTGLADWLVSGFIADYNGSTDDSNGTKRRDEELAEKTMLSVLKEAV
jgi:hypothetical protein